MIPYRQIYDVHLGPVTIQMWGLMVAIGILLALILAIRRSQKAIINKEHIYDLTFYSILAGVIGSRIGYVLFSWPDNLPLTLANAANITKGGLSFTFGLVAALAIALIYMKKNKINAFKFLNFIAPYIVIAHAIGRIGCFLIGDHLGKATNFILGVSVNGVVRHNVALYEIFALLVIFSILIYLRRKRLTSYIFAAYLMLYSALRFPLDFLRVDPTYYGLTAAQYILMGAFIISAGLMIIIKRKDDSHRTQR